MKQQKINIFYLFALFLVLNTNFYMKGSSLTPAQVLAKTSTPWVLDLSGGLKPIADIFLWVLHTSSGDSIGGISLQELGLVNNLNNQLQSSSVLLQYKYDFTSNAGTVTGYDADTGASLSNLTGTTGVFSPAGTNPEGYLRYRYAGGTSNLPFPAATTDFTLGELIKGIWVYIKSPYYIPSTSTVPDLTPSQLSTALATPYKVLVSLPLEHYYLAIVDMHQANNPAVVISTLRPKLDALNAKLSAHPLLLNYQLIYNPGFNSFNFVLNVYNAKTGAFIPKLSSPMQLNIGSAATVPYGYIRYQGSNDSTLQHYVNPTTGVSGGADFNQGELENLWVYLDVNATPTPSSNPNVNPTYVTNALKLIKAAYNQ